MITTEESLRCELAKTALGLVLTAEPDGSPSCDWCGRHDPPGGLADESMGGPEVYACADGEDCAKTRAEREPCWLSSQHPGWQQEFTDWASTRPWSQQAVHLTADPDPYALELVQDLVKAKLELAAPAVDHPVVQPHEPAPVHPAPVVTFPCQEPGCDHRKVTCAAVRHWATFGGQLEARFGPAPPPVAQPAAPTRRRRARRLRGLAEPAGSADYTVKGTVVAVASGQLTPRPPWDCGR